MLDPKAAFDSATCNFATLLLTAVYQRTAIPFSKLRMWTAEAAFVLMAIFYSSSSCDALMKIDLSYCFFLTFTHGDCGGSPIVMWDRWRWYLVRRGIVWLGVCEWCADELILWMVSSILDLALEGVNLYRSVIGSCVLYPLGIFSSGHAILISWWVKVTSPLHGTKGWNFLSSEPTPIDFVKLSVWGSWGTLAGFLKSLLRYY